MKKEQVIVKIDARNRVTIPKKMIIGDVGRLYKMYAKDGKIILEPVQEVHEREKWLFDSKNKHIVDQLTEALKQKATIDLGDFRKYLKKSK
jgi:hypothetical protein